MKAACGTPIIIMQWWENFWRKSLVIYIQHFLWLDIIIELPFLNCHQKYCFVRITLVLTDYSGGFNFFFSCLFQPAKLHRHQRMGRLSNVTAGGRDAVGGDQFEAVFLLHQTPKGKLSIIRLCWAFWWFGLRSTTLSMMYKQYKRWLYGTTSWVFEKN